MTLSTAKMIFSPFPMLLLVLGAASLFLALRRQPGRPAWTASRFAAWSAFAATLALYASSIGAAGGSAIRAMESSQPGQCGASGATFVILMSSLSEPADRPGQVERLTPTSFRRVVEGVRIARTSNAALLVISGGGPDGSVPEAVVGAELAAHLGWPPGRVLLETRSKDTAGNAAEVRRLLAGEAPRDVVLVTSALHMRRAAAAFLAQGLAVRTCPVDYTPLPWWKGPLAWVPQVRILQKSQEAWHEWLGLQWYRMTNRAS